jgi:hypothetical protein
LSFAPEPNHSISGYAVTQIAEAVPPILETPQNTTTDGAIELAKENKQNEMAVANYEAPPPPRNKKTRHARVSEPTDQLSCFLPFEDDVFALS